MNGRTSLYDKIRPAFDDLLTPEWIEPERNEPLKEYASRVADSLRPLGPIALGGTSFGGIVAREVAGVLGLTACALISTVREPSELPPRWLSFRPFAQNGEDALIEFAPQEMVARWKRLAPPEARFLRWAACAVSQWQLSDAAWAVETTHLHGDRDDVFPIDHVRPDEIVIGGGHVLPMTHPERVIAFLSCFRLGE